MLRPDEVIHGVSIDIADGEFVVIVGPSGCGKSTLLRMVAGLEAITAGTIAIAGRVVNDLEPRARDIAMVFQNYALYPHMSVFDNMAYGLRIAGIRGADLKARVEKTAAMLELTPYLARRPRELSGGQRQRVAMGRALVRGPAAFLLDEPLSNLDAKLRVQMRLQIKSLQREVSTTALYVTHDQVEAMTLADRLIVMNAGRAEQIDTPLAVYERPATVFVAGFIGSPAMNLVPATVRGRRRRSRPARPSPPPPATTAPRPPRHPPRAPRPLPPTPTTPSPSRSQPPSSSAPTPTPTATCPATAADFVVRLPGSAPPRPGDRLTVRADPGLRPPLRPGLGPPPAVTSVAVADCGRRGGLCDPIGQCRGVEGAGEGPLGPPSRRRSPGARAQLRPPGPSPRRRANGAQSADCAQRPRTSPPCLSRDAFTPPRSPR